MKKNQLTEKKLKAIFKKLKKHVGKFDTVLVKKTDI